VDISGNYDQVLINSQNNTVNLDSTGITAYIYDNSYGYTNYELAKSSQALNIATTRESSSLLHMQGGIQLDCDGSVISIGSVGYFDIKGSGKAAQISGVLGDLFTDSTGGNTYNFNGNSLVSAAGQTISFAASGIQVVG
jgi:hypothetical protein